MGETQPNVVRLDLLTTQKEEKKKKQNPNRVYWVHSDNKNTGALQ